MKMEAVSHTRKGTIANEEMLNIIKNDPGLSKYEISKELGWTMGKTDGAIGRLLELGKIFIKEIERDGRSLKLVYPDYLVPSDTISIPESEIEAGNPAWSDDAYFYALDSETIGISSKKFDIWSEISLFRKKHQIKHENGDILIELPQDFKNFYKLNEKHYSVSINANNILVTITGKIISTK
jgi:hypothetical protein